MKYFIVSDVHSFYDEMIEALNKAGFDKNNPEHIFVSCGDLLDRGPKGYNCLEFVNSLERKILIRGNHEDLLEECLARHAILSHDIHNGTDRTIRELADASVNFEGYEDDSGSILKEALNNKQLTTYLNSVVDYAEVDKYIFVHGYIPCVSEYQITGKHSKLSYSYKVVYRVEDNWVTGNWKSARWINAADAKQQGAYVKNKCIVSGHWHCNYAHWLFDKKEDKPYDEWTSPNFRPYKSKNLICLDACTAYSHIVNCVVLDI